MRPKRPSDDPHPSAGGRCVPQRGISVAIISTKLPILFGRDLGPFHLAKLDRYGFWSMAHEARTDWAMLLGTLFLIFVGAGPWSLDKRIARTNAHPRSVDIADGEDT